MLAGLLLLPLALAAVYPRQNATASTTAAPSATTTPAWNGSTSTWTLPKNVTFVTAKLPRATTTAGNITNAGNATAHARNATAANVTINVVGFSEDGLDQYLGIPFAQPPIGELRFERPKPAIYNTTTLNATVPGPACLQDARGQQDFFRGVGISEDCLTLNIMTPKGAANHTLNATSVANGTHVNGTGGLPVMVWIYGGGFTGGAAYAYLSPYFVNHSVTTDKPVILVTVAYRVGIFGFANGREMSEHGAANLGLRDQLLALEWVKDNIAAFGGDPTKVTVFGESAGAISISLLMLNQTQNLFRGAIMQSGAQSTAPLGPTNTTWQAPYDFLVNAAGCNVTANHTVAGNASTNSSQFDCLKRVPANTLVNASVAVKSQFQWALPFVWGPSVDGDLIPEAPYKMLLNGTFSRVPFITGTNRDEGTAFIPASLPGLVTPKFVYDLLLPKPPSAELVNAITTAYPNNPALGAPFDTGNETFGNAPIVKQIAAIITDQAFESRRRWFLRQANSHGWNQTWTYLWQGHSLDLPRYMGYTHGQEVLYVFGVVAASNATSNYTAADRALSRSMMDYWIRFAYDLDPNGKAINGTGHHNVTASLNGTSNSNSTGVTTIHNQTVVGSTTWVPHQYPSNKNSILFRSAPLNWFAYNVNATAGGNVTTTALTDPVALNTLNISIFQDDFRENRIAVFFNTTISDSMFFKRAQVAGYV